MRRRVAYSVNETVEDSGVGRSKIYAEIKEGRLRAVKCGGRTLILHVDRQRWLKRLKPVAKANGQDAAS